MLQSVLLRPNPNGKGRAAYQLVAGERRYRASLMADLEQIPAYIKELTDEEAEDAQYAENVQRKNLTQIEEAKKLQRDLDRPLIGEAQAERVRRARGLRVSHCRPIRQRRNVAAAASRNPPGEAPEARRGGERRGEKGTGKKERERRHPRILVQVGCSDGPWITGRFN